MRRESVSTRFPTLPAPGSESRHNLKYWTRQPYLGFGVDAHSMLTDSANPHERRSLLRPDSLEEYVAGAPLEHNSSLRAGRSRRDFLSGLAPEPRRGSEKGSRRDFRRAAATAFSDSDFGLRGIGLLEREGDVIRLTPRGRLLVERSLRAIHFGARWRADSSCPPLSLTTSGWSVRLAKSRHSM